MPKRSRSPTDDVMHFDKRRFKPKLPGNDTKSPGVSKCQEKGDLIGPSEEGSMPKGDSMSSQSVEEGGGSSSTVSMPEPNRRGRPRTKGGPPTAAVPQNLVLGSSPVKRPPRKGGKTAEAGRDLATQLNPDDWKVNAVIARILGLSKRDAEYLEGLRNRG